MSKPFGEYVFGVWNDRGERWVEVHASRFHQMKPNEARKMAAALLEAATWASVPPKWKRDAQTKAPGVP